MKVCLNQNTLGTTPTETFLQVARRAEFEAVELTMGRVEAIIEKRALSKLKRSIDDQGLIVASINGPENFNLLRENEFGALLSRTRRLASASREIGCNLLVPVPSPIAGQKSRDTIVTQAAQALNRLSETCGEQINLGLEFLGMQGCSISDLQTAAEVINRVARPNVGLVLDSFHMHLSMTPFSEIAKIKSDRVFLLHVNDSEAGDIEKLTDANRLFPGEGVIDLQELGTSCTGWIRGVPKPRTL